MNTRWAGPVIAVTFLMSMIAIGHGIGPVGFLLVFGTFTAAPFALAGWLGVSLLLAAAIFPGRPATIMIWTGSGISFVVWLYLLWDSDWNSTILLSVHYFAALFYFLIYRPVVYFNGLVPVNDPRVGPEEVGHHQSSP